jgi:FkbM family methyltransferase
MKRLFRHVISFEPADESFALLRDAYGDDPQVTLRQLAVADHDGILVTSVRAMPIQSGQLVAAQMPYDDYSLGRRLDGTLPWGPELGTRQVECMTADTLAESYGLPDFVKVDTEGHELQVLRGAVGLLELGRTSWLIEFHDEPLHRGCTELLEQAGYQVETVRHPHYPPGSEMYSRHGWIKAGKTEET